MHTNTPHDSQLGSDVTPTEGHPADDDWDHLDPGNWDEPVSLEWAHQLFTPQDFVRALEASATTANRRRRARYAPLHVNLQGLAVEVAFPGRRVAQSYSTLFDFPVNALLEAAGARFDSVLCCQPRGEEYGADGLTRLTLNGRGYLIGWCAGDDSNHDVVTASWTPADDERLFERAERGEFFSRTMRDYPLVGQCKSVVSSECSAIILDRLWGRRRPAAWGKWLRRWLAWYRAEVGDDLIEIDSEKVESTGIWTPEDLQAFATDLHADPSRVLAGIANGSLSTAGKQNLVLLRRLDDAGALRPPYRPPAVDPSSPAPVVPIEPRTVDAGPARSPLSLGPAKVLDYAEGRELAWHDREKTGREPRYTPVTPREGWRPLSPGSTTVKYLDEVILLPGGGLASVSAAERSVTTFAEVGGHKALDKGLADLVNACAARIEATGQLAMWGDCLHLHHLRRPTLRLIRSNLAEGPRPGKAGDPEVGGSARVAVLLVVLRCPFR